ncbi:MAG TPA: AAA family ATPase [Pyrinomonadaceae bacterium]|jgi:general secretion pathway protein A|nr:AAA family ATPase [Pyrinomonadaceae bacterium]
MILESVFSISPNPRFFYVTPSVQAAIAKTQYVIRARQGLTTIIGDVGLGKTSLLRLLYNEYDDNPEFTTAFIVNPKQTSETAFLKAICTEFGVKTKRSQRETEYELRGFLIEQYKEGKNVLLFIDEAQQLRGPMFEQIRQILNFETDETKLISIVMAGQVELRYRLADRSKRALVSRIAVSSSLDALSPEEISGMIDFRCTVAGVKNPFEPEAIRAVYHWSKGVPREAIKLCAMSVQYAALNNLKQIPADLVELAAGDIVRPSEESSPEPAPAKRGTMRAVREAV